MRWGLLSRELCLLPVLIDLLNQLILWSRASDSALEEMRLSLGFASVLEATGAAGGGCDRSMFSEARRRFKVRWLSLLSSPIHSALSLAHCRDSRRSLWALFGRGPGCSRPFSAAADLGIVWISASPVLAPFAGGDEAVMIGEEMLFLNRVSGTLFRGALATVGWWLSTCLESLNHFQPFCYAG